MPGIIVTPVVRAVTEADRDLNIEVVRTSWDDQVEMIHDGRVDVSFVRPPIPRLGLVVVPLFSEPRVAVLPAGHPLAGNTTVSISELAQAASWAGGSC
jgi:DNA-binding transcriptional LysR family regulator